MTIKIEEKEQEDNERFYYILTGAIILGFIAIIASIIAYVKRKKNNDNGQNFCISCNAAFSVSSIQRPITVSCPICGAFNRIE
jgi:uncharacterized membrane protein